MKILIIDELFYPVGGIQVRFKDLAEQWVGFGHSVTMTAIDHKGNLPEREVINGVIYNRLLKDSNYYKTGKFGRKLSTIVKYSLKLRPYFKEEWDLIIFGQFPVLPQLFYKFFYRKRAKTALDFVEYRDSKLWRVINNIVLNSVDKVVCISEHVKACSLAFRKDNLYVIPSFVDVGKSISKSKTNYIFLGRMEEHKHPEAAVDAVILYNEKYSKAMNLILVGSGNMLEDLKAKYKDISFIKFLGGVDEETKADVLANGRILIFPSEREGLPIVVIEAMSYGIPTITTDYVGNGTQYFVKQENIGLIASPANDAIVDKIAELESNYSFFEERCNQVKQRYDIELLSQKYLTFFG